LTENDSIFGNRDSKTNIDLTSLHFCRYDMIEKFHR
jgi:hypothetical protein